MNQIEKLVIERLEGGYRILDIKIEIRDIIFYVCMFFQVLIFHKKHEIFMILFLFWKFIRIKQA